MFELCFKDMKNSNKTCHLVAISDHIAKIIDVHMYAIVYCLFTKFEQNWFRGIGETAKDAQTDARTDGAQFIVPLSGLVLRGTKIGRKSIIPIRST